MTAVGRVALLLALLITAPAGAQERILSFVSDVTVGRDGDLDVVETIRVQAEGRDIRRGILRDFPTLYTRRDGTRAEVGFTVEAVRRDGETEPYALEHLSNGVRVRIGSAETYLRNGPHTYEIRYRTTRQIGFFQAYDELYWNATGTGWTFAIDTAEARITLPEAVPFRQTAFYTGPQGATGQDARVADERPGTIVFRTTRPLPPRSGLTVAVAWQKGVVTPPGDTEKLGWWIADNLALVLALAGAAGLIGYYVFAWMRVGRDPARGTVIPLFGPPEGFSAAGVRYVRQMDFDDRTFAAALVDVAVRGRLAIADVGGVTRVERRAGGPLPAPELAMHDKLFGNTEQVMLEQENHQRISAARSALRQGLAEAYRGIVFNDNTGWSVAGAVAWAALSALLVLTAFLTRDSDVGGPVLIGIAFGSVGAVGATLIGRALLGGRTKVLPALLGAVFFGVFAVVGLAVLTAVVDNPIDAVPGLVAVALAPLVALSFTWLKAPTPEGARVIDRIEGFRQYLGTAEEERLEFLTPPEKTPALFEKFLPYAIALGVENTWAARFAGVLAAAGAGAAVAEWYTTNDGFASDPSAWVDRLGDGLSQTVASAATAPGDSSGSGGSDGGGSSGGGGGGGGGSGW